MLFSLKLIAKLLLLALVLLALVLLGLGAGPALALNGDSENTANNGDNRSANANAFRAPISIAADSAEQNEKKGVTIYRGNVAIEQGTLTINADTVTIETVDIENRSNVDNANSVSTDSVSRTVTTIVASGFPARFSQISEGQITAINAKGNTIRYAVDSGIIQLEENASIDKFGSKVSGEKIEYFINEELVKAQADPNDKNTRVHTVIIPGSNASFQTQVASPTAPAAQTDTDTPTQ